MKDFINSKGEQLETAFHPGKEDRPLVIIGHGVTGNMDRSTSVGLAEGLSAKGWPCLRISFSGNGNSQGNFEDATISKEVEDFKAILDHIGQEVIYIGHSMGGAVGVKTAVSDSRIKALVSMAGMVRTEKFCVDEFGDVTPDKGLMWDETGCPLSQAFVDDLTNIGDLFSDLETLKCPILFLHGTTDDVVLPADSIDGHAKVTTPKEIFLMEGEGHTFSEEAIEVSVNRISFWLQSIE